LRSIAAAIRFHSGAVVASLSIAGPAHRVSKKILLSYARELVGATDAISQRLGYQAPRIPGWPEGLRAGPGLDVIPERQCGNPLPACPAAWECHRASLNCRIAARQTN
jgi:Bacterial transcriptional regulator